MVKYGRPKENRENLKSSLTAMHMNHGIYNMLVFLIGLYNHLRNQYNTIDSRYIGVPYNTVAHIAH